MTRAADDGGPHRQVATLPRPSSPGTSPLPRPSLPRRPRREHPRCHAPRSPGRPRRGHPLCHTPRSPRRPRREHPLCHAPSLPRRPRRGPPRCHAPAPPPSPAGTSPLPRPRSPVVPGGDIHSQAVHRQHTQRSRMKTDEMPVGGAKRAAVFGGPRASHLLSGVLGALF